MTRVKEWAYRKRKPIIVILVLIVLLLMFVPFIPSNAVRLSILENGHPIAAILSGPEKLPKSEVRYYSGNKSGIYYRVNVIFSTDSADTSVVAAYPTSNKGLFRYRATPESAVGT
ncbi:hypothetical protein [Levilactobacillus brevis]|uniref:hypothetical protein n=1 Tax=Levilactobacillus brevis TaxID=1580 RepID=UPI000A20A778|nr:hypothetical protein [Levilactobacillus brevis]ARN90934.1 hypothetical protein AZI09_11060 [Levilactobacillus brevis]ARN98566.1 hypothetical protein AZI10_11415 [Levilactobacillus brevis]